MIRRDSNRDIENLVIEDVETTMGIVPGDFRRAIDIMWMTVSYLMRRDELYDIQVPKFGRFYTPWKLVNRSIKKEWKKKLRDRSKLEALFSKRRWIIESGGADKTYYLRKLMCNGRTEDERRSAASALRFLQMRLGGFGKARQQAEQHGEQYGAYSS